MRYLLDTHAFLWWTAEPGRLSSRARDLIVSPENDVLLSAASAWEMAIKSGLGRLNFKTSVDRYVAEQMSRNRILALPVTLSHALYTADLPPHHRDPFDRMLVAQARLERVPIISYDPWIRRYDVQVEW